MNDAYEAAYSDALSAVACGVPRDETFTSLLESYEALEGAEISDVLADAFNDALRQGIEREDIDPSWF